MTPDEKIRTCWSFDYTPEEMVMIQGDEPPVGTGIIWSARDCAGVGRYGMRELDITEALADLNRERAAMSPEDGPLIGWAQYNNKTQRPDGAR